MKQFGNLLFLRELPPFNQPPISEQFFLDPPLCPIFKNEIFLPLNFRGGGGGGGGGAENIFTCIRIKLSCTFYLRTLVKIKIGGKILFQKSVKTSFYRQFSI